MEADLQEFRDRMKQYKSYRSKNPGKTYLDWKSTIKQYNDIIKFNDNEYFWNTHKESQQR